MIKKVLVEEYVDKLIASTYGLYKPKNSWGERDIKKVLIQKSDSTDCVVIGSSHVMQVSSSRNKKSLSNTCGSLLNLGVPGGTLEDYLALSYKVLSSDIKVKYVVFGIDPWALDFQRDSRWQKYKDSKSKMSELINNDAFDDFLYSLENQWNLAINLINYEYFLASIDFIKSSGGMNQRAQDSEIIIREVDKKFDLSKGVIEAVTLNDGSHIYSQKYISDNTPPSVNFGGENYKIKDEKNINEAAVKLFIGLIQELKNNNMGVIFLLTPYHHNVWEDKESITTRALLEVEPFVKSLAYKYGVSVLGSYDPYVIGCAPDEFYDYMHPRDSCLSKIRN